VDRRAALAQRHGGVCDTEAARGPPVLLTRSRLAHLLICSAPAVVRGDPRPARIGVGAQLTCIALDRAMVISSSRVQPALSGRSAPASPASCRMASAGHRHEDDDTCPCAQGSPGRHKQADRSRAVTVFPFLLATVMTWRGIIGSDAGEPSWVHRSGGLPRRRRPRRHRRFGDRRRRPAGATTGGALVEMLAPAITTPLPPGRRGGLPSWRDTVGKARSRPVSQDTHLAGVVRGRVRWLGRRVDNAAREVTARAGRAVGRAAGWPTRSASSGEPRPMV